MFHGYIDFGSDGSRSPSRSPLSRPLYVLHTETTLSSSENSRTHARATHSRTHALANSGTHGLTQSLAHSVTVTQHALTQSLTLTHSRAHLSLHWLSPPLPASAWPKLSLTNYTNMSDRKAPF